MERIDVEYYNLDNFIGSPEINRELKQRFRNIQSYTDNANKFYLEDLEQVYNYILEYDEALNLTDYNKKDYYIFSISQLNRVINKLDNIPTEVYLDDLESLAIVLIKGFPLDALVEEVRKEIDRYYPIKNFKITNLKLTPYHKIHYHYKDSFGNLKTHKTKINHLIIEIEYKGRLVSFCYNENSNVIMLNVASTGVRYFKTPKKATTYDLVEILKVIFMGL